MSAMLVRGIRAGKGNLACKNMEILENYARETWARVAKSWLLPHDARAVERAIWVKRRGELGEAAG